MRTAQKWLDIELHDLGPDYDGGPQFTCIKCKQTYPTHETSRCPASDLAVELGGVFTPGDWVHDWPEYQRYGSMHCRKCDKTYNEQAAFSPCLVPDRIKLDWNTAKHYQEQCDEYLFIVGAQEVRKILFPDACQDKEWLNWWLAYMCRPEDAKYVLIIAAMAVEGAKT